MHCNACVILIESELKELTEVRSARANLSDNTVEITANFGDKETEHIIRDLNEVLKPHGYTLTLEKQGHQVKWSDFKISIPVALVFIAFFIFLQKIGLINLI